MVMHAFLRRRRRARIWEWPGMKESIVIFWPRRLILYRPAVNYRRSHYKFCAVDAVARREFSGSDNNDSRLTRRWHKNGRIKCPSRAWG